MVRLPKPLIALQLDDLEVHVWEMINGQLRFISVFGPKGIGKTERVIQVYQTSGKTLTKIDDATLVGLRTQFLAGPSGHYWLDDYDTWMSERPIITLFKQTLMPRAKIREAVNANTMRKGTRTADSEVRLICTSNLHIDTLKPEIRDQLETLFDRGHVVIISSDPLELLKFLDWWIVEEDYFVTEMFRNEANINRRLSLREIQDVLNFIHRYAWRLRLSLRFVRDAAMDRVRYPDEWDRRLLRSLPPAIRNDTPPPAPLMFGHNVRCGLPTNGLTGFDKRQAKRLLRDHPHSAADIPLWQADPVPASSSVPAAPIDPAPATSPDLPVSAPRPPTTPEPLAPTPVSPEKNGRAVKDGLLQDIARMLAPQLKVARITVGDDGIEVKAQRDRKFIVVATLERPAELENAMFGISIGRKIKGKGFEIAELSAQQSVNNWGIGDIPWSHQVTDYAAVKQACVDARLSPGPRRNQDMITSETLSGKAIRLFDSKPLEWLLHKHPEVINFSEKTGPINIPITTASGIYQFYLQGQENPDWRDPEVIAAYAAAEQHAADLLATATDSDAVQSGLRDLASMAMRENLPEPWSRFLDRLDQASGQQRTPEQNRVLREVRPDGWWVPYSNDDGVFLCYGYCEQFRWATWDELREVEQGDTEASGAN